MEHSDAPPENDDLRTRLHAMETKAKRLRNQRNSYSDDARSSAEKRDTVQSQGREIKDQINERLEEQKSIRDAAKQHRDRRDEIQTRIRELIGKSKGKRDDDRNSRSAVVELAEVESGISNIEDRIMTDGRLSLDKENKLLKQLKSLKSRRNQLMPEVEENSIIKLDLKDLDGSILTLKAEADSEHNLMLEAHKKADEIWEEIKPLFEERDFLRSEGDRYHAIFVSSRRAADEVHATLVDLYSEVDEIKNVLKEQEQDQKKSIEEYNREAKRSLNTPSESEEMANDLANLLLSSGSITLGGTGVDEGRAEKGSLSDKRAGRRKIKARRGR